jgi:plasmid stabilization system protein ParE
MMKKYTIIITEKAKADMQAFYNYILYEYKQPLTALRNRIELRKTFQKLSVYAGSIAISQSNYIQSLCGPGARRVNCKKMAIIYVIHNDYVYIKRVIAGALIH